MQHCDCLLTDMSDSDSLHAMMHERERWPLILTRLPHPGIPPVYALGELDDGSPYLAMKLSVSSRA